MDEHHPTGGKARSSPAAQPRPVLEPGKGQPRQKVQAGLLADAAKVIKSISENVFKFIDKFGDYQITVTKEQKLDNGGVKMWCEYGGTPFGMIVAPIWDKDNKKTGKVNVLVRCHNKDTRFDGIRDLDVEEKVIGVLKKELGFVDKEENSSASSSRKLLVTLQKVVSGTDCCVNLTSVSANFSGAQASELLDTVLDNETFLDSIGTEPVSFEISDSGESIDIQTTDRFDVTETYQNLLQQALRLWGCFTKLFWYTDDAETQGTIGDYQALLTEEMNLLGRRLVEERDSPDGEYSGQGNPFIVDNGIFLGDDSAGTVQEEIESLLPEYVQSLQLYSANFPEEMQWELDTHLQDWESAPWGTK